MFFSGFHAQPPLPINPETAYRTEYWTMRILTTAIPSSLRQALGQGRLMSALYDELAFAGDFHRGELPVVRAYLEREAGPGSPLLQTARELVDHPDDDVLRAKLLSPLETPPSSSVIW